MSRTSSFTWSSTCLIAVLTVVIAIVLIVFVLAPMYIVRKNNLWILNLTIFGAKLLTKLNCTGWAVLYTLTTGNTLLFLYSCSVCRARHIWCIEKL